MMISSPACRNVQSVEVIAPMPEAVAKASSAPSRAIIRSSNMRTVGLP